MYSSSSESGAAASRRRIGSIAVILIALLFLHIAGVLGLAFAALQFLHIAHFWPALLLSAGLVWLLRMMIVAHNFYLAARFRSAMPAQQRLTWRGKIRLFITESNATIFSAYWHMCRYPFSKRLVTDSQDLPVLLIHGYICNSGYWQSLSSVLSAAKINHFALDLEPIFGGIDEFTPMVQRAIDALCLATGSEKVIIVAHSMGGLVARAYLRAHGAARVAKVITLGTPHHGTGLANGAPGINGRQMRWNGGASSAWLRELAAGETGRTRALFTSIYSYHDNIVAPQLSSHLPGAENIAYSGIGHVALALDPAIQAKVVEEIRRSRPQCG